MQDTFDIASWVQMSKIKKNSPFSVNDIAMKKRIRREKKNSDQIRTNMCSFYRPVMDIGHICWLGDRWDLLNIAYEYQKVFHSFFFNELNALFGHTELLISICFVSFRIDLHNIWLSFEPTVEWFNMQIQIQTRTQRVI